MPIEKADNPSYPAGSETIEVKSLLKTSCEQGDGYNYSI